LNACFIPILDYLLLYKSEIGQTLQRMVESYNILIMMQFESYFTTENLKEKEFTQRL